ncbi:Mediator of RNA polymerase II transcription subunit 6 [Clarireedia jacksonii]
MATHQDPPLDEIQWRDPTWLAAHGGVHDNSILHYFAESPFYDRTSNNGILTSQALFNPNMFYLLATRAAFEGRLKTMSGLEFIVAQEPAEMAPGTGTGVWVIRKQTRRKRAPEDDEIIVHSSYFVVGENIYMAPAVSDVLGSRMLAILTSLTNAISKVSELPNFSPSLGHTYLPPVPPRTKGIAAGTTQVSKENTPMPDGLPADTKKSTASSSNNILGHHLLEDSLNITLKYGDEYMDENPITGYPGDFHLSTTGRKEKEKLMVPPTTKPAGFGLAGKGAAPTPLKTDIAVQKKAKNGEKSPRTPGTGKPKRRKSKSALSGDVSPT